MLPVNELPDTPPILLSNRMWPDVDDVTDTGFDAAHSLPTRTPARPTPSSEPAPTIGVAPSIASSTDLLEIRGHIGIVPLIAVGYGESKNSRTYIAPPYVALLDVKAVDVML